MAVEANPRNVRQFEHIKRVVAAKAEKVKKEKRSMAEQLTSLRLTFKSKAGEDGKLFGSITSMDIQKELGIQGIELDRKKIHLDSPIKRLGEHTVHVKLHSDITADIQVEVVQE
jgi:large subunit ribosomal protein L9